MTTDTNLIADLPKCGRRWMMQNEDGVQIWCEPPTRPEGLTDPEAVADTIKWFMRRQVSSDVCLACKVSEPEQTPRAGLNAHGVKSAKETAPPQGNVTHARPRIFENGTIAYPKRGWEPPPVPSGYRRKVDDLRSSDAWMFLPVLEDCKHRTRTIKYSSCGAANIIYQCGLFGQVQPPKCQQCREDA